MSEAEMTRASVKEKLTRYLLNPDHPLDGEKAKFFAQALGFTRDNMEPLVRRMRFDFSRAVRGEATEFGIKYRQTIKTVGVNGRSIPIYTVWIRNHDNVVRFVIAFPGD